MFRDGSIVGLVLSWSLELVGDSPKELSGDVWDERVIERV